MGKKITEKEAKPIAKMVNRFRYYCEGCTGRVMYSPEPIELVYQVCPNCGKIHDGSNYREENWLPMNEEEVANQ